MRARWLLSLCFALMIVATDVAAQEQSTPLNIRNAGARTCEQLINTYAQPGNEFAKTAFLEWAAGYTTAAARANNVIDVFPIGDSLQMVQFVVLVCREDPARNVESAVLRTVIRLQPFWVRSSPNRLTLTWNDKKVAYYEEAVRPLQQVLANLGSNIVPDGVYGEATGQAVQELAQRLGLEATPLPSGVLLYAITRPRQ